MSSRASDSTTAFDPSLVVDLDRYHLGDEAALRDVVAEARRSLRENGVALLENFLLPDAVDTMVAECRALEARGHHSVTMGTPYLSLPDESFPPGHPRRHEVRSSLAAVAYDLIPPSSPLRCLYEWAPMSELVRLILGIDTIHRYSDPLGALNIAVMCDGDELGWHFDQTDFVVSIALQSADVGGDFESATRVRNDDDECYAAVASVLAGRRDGVTVMPMQPGALMLFQGRHSMHRVTPVEGATPRYVALLAYDTRAGTDSSELLKLVRYGRLP